MPQTTVMAHDGGLKSKEAWGTVNGHDKTLSAIFPGTKSPPDPRDANMVDSPKIDQSPCEESPTTFRDALAGSNLLGDREDEALLETDMTPEPVFSTQSSCSDLLDDITSVIAADTGQFLEQLDESACAGQTTHRLTRAAVSAKKTPPESGNATHLNKRKTKRKNAEQKTQKVPGGGAISNSLNDDNNNALGCFGAQPRMSCVSPSCERTGQTDSSQATVQCEHSTGRSNSRLQPQMPFNFHLNPQLQAKSVGNDHTPQDAILLSSSPLSLVEKTEKMSLEDELPLSSQADGSCVLACRYSDTLSKSTGSHRNGRISPAPSIRTLRTPDPAPMSCGSDISLEKSPVRSSGQAGDTEGFEQQPSTSQNVVAAAAAFERQISSASQAVSSTGTCSSEGRRSEIPSSSSTLEARGVDDSTVPGGRERNNVTPNNEYDRDPDADTISCDGEGGGEFEEELRSLELLDESIQSLDDFGEEELRSKGRGRKKTPKVVRPDKPRRLEPKVHNISNRGQIPYAMVRELLYRSGQSHLAEPDHLPPEIPVMFEAAGPNRFEMKLFTETPASQISTLAAGNPCLGSIRGISPNAVPSSENVALRRTPSPANTRKSSPSSSRGRPATPTGKFLPSNMCNKANNNIPNLEELSPMQAAAGATRGFVPTFDAVQQSSDNIWSCHREPTLTSPAFSVLSPPESSAVSPSHATRSSATESTALTNDTRSSCGNLSNQYSPQPATASPPPVGVVQSPTSSIQMDGPILSWRDISRRSQPYRLVQLQQRQPSNIEQQQLQLQHGFLRPVNPPSFQPNTSNNNNNNNCATNTSCNTAGSNSGVPVCQANMMPSHLSTPGFDLDMFLLPTSNMQQAIGSCIGPEALQSETSAQNFYPCTTAVPQGSTNTHTFASQAQRYDLKNIDSFYGASTCGDIRSNPTQQGGAVRFLAQRRSAEANQRVSLNKQSVYGPTQVLQERQGLSGYALGCSGDVFASNVVGDEAVLPTVIGLSGTPVAMQATATKRKVPVSKSSQNQPQKSGPSPSTKQIQGKRQANEIGYGPIREREPVEIQTLAATNCHSAGAVQGSPAFYGNRTAQTYGHKAVSDPNQGQMPTPVDGLHKGMLAGGVAGTNPYISQTVNQKQLRQLQTGTSTTPINDPNFCQETSHEQRCSDNVRPAIHAVENMSPSLKICQNLSPDDIQKWINGLPSMNFMDDSMALELLGEQESICMSNQSKQINHPSITVNQGQLQQPSNSIDISAYISSPESLERLRGKKTSLDQYIQSNSTGMGSGSGDWSWLQELSTRQPKVPETQVLGDRPVREKSPPPLANLSHKDVTDVLNLKGFHYHHRSDSNPKSCYSPAAAAVRVSQTQSRVSSSSYPQGDLQNMPPPELEPALPDLNHLQGLSSSPSMSDHALLQCLKQSQYAGSPTISTTAAHQYSTATPKQKFDGVQQTPILNLQRGSQNSGTTNRFPVCLDTLPSNIRPPPKAISSYEDLAMLGQTNALQIANQSTPVTYQNRTQHSNNILPQNPVSEYPMEFLQPCGPPSDIEMKSSSLTDPVVLASNVHEMGRPIQEGQISLGYTTQNVSVASRFPPSNSSQGLQHQHQYQHNQQVDQSQHSFAQQSSRQEHPHQWTNQPSGQFAMPKSLSNGVEEEILNLPHQHVLDWIQKQQMDPASNTIMSIESIPEAQTIWHYEGHGQVYLQGEYPEGVSLGYQKVSTSSQQQTQQIYPNRVPQVLQLQQQQQQQQQQQEPQQPAAASSLKLTKENLQNFEESFLQGQHEIQGLPNQIGSTSNLSQMSHLLSRSGTTLNQCRPSNIVPSETFIHNHLQNSPFDVLQHPGTLRQSSTRSNQASSSQHRVPMASERSDGRGRAQSPSPHGARSNCNSSPCPSSYISRGCSPSPRQQSGRKEQRSPSPTPSSRRSGCRSPAPDQAVVRSKRCSPSPRPSSNRSTHSPSPTPARRSPHFSEGNRRPAQEQHRPNSQDHRHHHHHHHHHHQKQQQHQSSSRTVQWVIEQQQKEQQQQQQAQQHQIQLQHQNLAQYNKPHLQHQPKPSSTHQPLPRLLSDEHMIPQGTPNFPKVSSTYQKSPGSHSPTSKARKASNPNTQGTKSGTSVQVQDKLAGSIGDAGPITLSSGSDAGRLGVPGSSDVGDLSVERSVSMSSGPGNSSLEGETVLHMLSSMDIPEEQIPKIAENHLQLINERSSRGETPLFVAVQSGREDVARFLLSRRADPNLLCMSSSRGCRVDQTCLHEAVAKGSEEMVKLLLTLGHNTDVNSVRPSTVMTPLMLALELHTHERNNREIVKMLINHGASLSANDSTWKTPLMYAVQSGDVTLVEDMLHHIEADKRRDLVTMTTKRGLTCLHFAAERRNTIAVEEKRRLMRKLILAGGDPSYKNTEGDSARDWDKVNIEAVLADLRRA